MSVDQGRPARLPPAGVVIRAELPADVDAITQVHRAAFPDEDVALLVELLRASPAWIPELSLVADVDGQVVGHVAVTMATLRTDARDLPIANLSPLGVLPARRRLGIGSALVEEVVQRTARRGEPLVIVEGDPAFYARLGFEYSVPHGIHIALPDWARPECAQVRLLGAADPRPRGHVVYPPPFQTVD